MSYESEILELHKERYSLIEQLQQLGADDVENQGKELDNKVDVLSEKIMDIIKQFIDELDFDFVMQQLSYLGECPNLLNDDNGNWAVTGQGFQSVASGDEPEDVEMHFMVEASLWKPTPREALIKYLSEE